jgi:hypothetical protein
MQPGPIPTLGDLQRTTPWVWLWCENLVGAQLEFPAYREPQRLRSLDVDDRGHPHLVPRRLILLLS